MKKVNNSNNISLQLISCSNEIIKYDIQQKKTITLHGLNYLPNVSLSDKLHDRLKQYILQKKDRTGVLFGTQLKQSYFELQYLNVVGELTEQEIFTKVFVEECACTVFAINNKLSLKERLEYEVRRCREGYKFQPMQHVGRGLSILEQVCLSIIRSFLVFKLEGDALKTQRFCFYPSTSISIRHIKFIQCKYTPSSLLKSLIKLQDHVTEQNLLQELQKGTFGYLTFDQTKHNFGVIKRTSNTDSKCIAGLWIYIHDIKVNSHQINPKYHKYLWALATMYSTNTHLQKMKVLKSNKKNLDQSFIICTFSSNSKKPTPYLVTLEGNSNKWVFSEGSEQTIYPTVPITFSGMSQSSIESVWQSKIHMPNKLKQTILPSKQQPTVEEQEEEFVPTFNNADNLKTQRNHFKNDKSVKSKEHRVFSNDTFAKSQADAQSLRQSQFNDKISEKSYDQKDVQIRQLKKELEFYKERYNNLEKIMIMNQTMMQQYNPQILNQMTLMQNQMMGFQQNIQYPFINSVIQQPVQQMYTPPNQFHPLFASQAGPSQNVLPPLINNISQSSVIQSIKDESRQQISPPIPSPPFMKKQSNPQIMPILKLNHQLSAPLTKIQISSPSQQLNIIATNQYQQQQHIIEQSETIQQKQSPQPIPNHYQSQQQSPNWKHNLIQPNLQHDQQQQQQFDFSQHSQIDLNLSAIPIQKSPRRYDATQLLDYSSLAYSHTSYQNNHRYSIPNQDSQDYEQSQQARQIQLMFRKINN